MTQRLYIEDIASRLEARPDVYVTAAAELLRSLAKDIDTTKQSKEATMTQREEFEAWYVKTYSFASTMLGKFEREGCDYTDTTVNVAWRAFQYAQAAQPADEVWVTKDSAGAIVAVTRQDVEGRILQVIAKAAQAAQNHIEQDLVMVSTQPAQMPGWLPIESAPKDGTCILLWEQYSTDPFVGYWGRSCWCVSHEHVDAEGGWDGAIVVDNIQMPITHWMPLPTAPSTKEKAE